MPLCIRARVLDTKKPGTNLERLMPAYDDYDID